MKAFPTPRISTAIASADWTTLKPAGLEWPERTARGRAPSFHIVFASLLFLVTAPAELLVAEPAGMEGVRRPEWLLELALPAPPSQNVLLGLDVAVGVAHDIDFFNRRRFLTFKYRTSDAFGNVCSDEDLQDVELVITLPAEVQFAEAREFGQVVPPSQQAAGTVTWSFGTLNGNAHCDPDTKGTEFVVAVDVDPSIADDTPLQATASISTSTAGDDPSDNQVSVVFAAVMFPLQVFVKSVHSECEAASSMKSGDDGNGIVCSPGPALISVPATASPGLLGEVPIAGRAALLFRIGGHSTSATGKGSVESTIEVRNPNLFALPLHFRFNARFNCHVSDGTSTARPLLSGVITDEAECGFGNLDKMDENLSLRFFAEGGPDGVCRTIIRVHSTERGDETTENISPACKYQRVKPAVTTASGTTPGTLELPLGLAIGDVQGGGWATANAIARACVGVHLTSGGVAGSPCSAKREVMSVVGTAPVDLLLANESGQRVGRVDDPNLGPLNYADIPGAYYSGPGSEPQEIVAGLPDPGAYRLTVIGTGDGPYTVTVGTEDEDGAVINEQSFSGQASAGSALQQDLLLAPDGRLALKPAMLSVSDVAQQLLGAEGVLNEDAIRFLDLSGNDNGIFDVGDFRAFLVASGELTMAGLSDAELIAHLKAGH